MPYLRKHVFFLNGFIPHLRFCIKAGSAYSARGRISDALVTWDITKPIFVSSFYLAPLPPRLGIMASSSRNLTNAVAGPSAVPTLEQDPFSPQNLFNVQGLVAVITGGGSGEDYSSIVQS